MNRLARLVCTLGLVALGACGMRIPFVSVPEGDGTFFKTRLCGVSLDNRTREARLKLELEVIRTLPRNAFVETEFQNPLERSVMTVSRSVTGKERTLEMLSPPFAEVRSRRYETVTRVYAAADRKQVLGVHTYACESLVDLRELGPGFR